VDVSSPSRRGHTLSEKVRRTVNDASVLTLSIARASSLSRLRTPNEISQEPFAVRRSNGASSAPVFRERRLDGSRRAGILRRKTLDNISGAVGIAIVAIATDTMLAARMTTTTTSDPGDCDHGPTSMRP
jgi:hypothetical protein